MKNPLIRSIAAFGALVLAGSASANTYEWTSSGIGGVGTTGTTYTIVEIDPFADGGTAGNTTAVGGGFFSAGGASPTTMRDRTVAPFNTAYEGIAGATNRVFDNAGSGPETVTTVSGLTAGRYDVFAVYLYADPDGPQGDNSMGLQAKLNGPVDGTVYNALNITEKMAVNPEVKWAVGLAPIGTTSEGVTSFTVNFDDAETSTPAQNRVDYIGVAYIPSVTVVTDFNGGDMLVAGNWTNGLPVAPKGGFVATGGSFDDGNAGVADWWLTMTAGTIAVGQDWNFTGASKITIDGGTLDVAGDILSGDNSTMTFTGGTVDWEGSFEPAGTPGGTIAVTGGTFTGTATAGTTFGNVTGGIVTVSGGSITASNFDFSDGDTTTLGGSAVLSGDTATFGWLDITVDWTGSFTLTGFSGSDWESEFTSGNITLDGAFLDAAGFALNFAVTNGGQTLAYSATTEFLGGDINTAANWTNGVPAALKVGTIAADGTNAVTIIGYGTGSVVNMTAGIITSDGTNGFNVTAGGGGTWNISGGKIITRFFLANGVNTIINLSGGTIELADVEGAQHMGAANEGTFKVSGSAVLDGTQATTVVQTGGTVDIDSNWTGTWTWGTYSGYDWENLFTAGSITLDGAPLDLAGFEANFAVTNSGQTLQIGTGGTPDQGAPTLIPAGFNEFDEFVINAVNLDPTKAYDLTRGTDLATFPDFVDIQVFGVSSFQFIDDAPPAGKAFYRLDEVE